MAIIFSFKNLNFQPADAVVDNVACKVASPLISCSLYAEISLQTSGQHHTRLDRSTEPSLQHSAHRLPRPRERVGAGETSETPEAGDRGLEPRLLDQAEHQLQPGSLGGQRAVCTPGMRSMLTDEL